MSKTKVDPEANGNSTVFSVAKNGGLQRVEVSLIGTTPLLLNAMPHDVLLALQTKEKPAKTAERPGPREIADSKIHRLPDGRPCIPSRMLYANMIAAGQFVRLDGKRQVSTATSTMLPGLLSLVSFEIPLKEPGTDESPAAEVDVQQGRNPNGGEAVCLIRPRFDRWQIDFEILVDRKTFSLEQARGLVELAGRRCGLGDFRPNCKGTFGQFAIVLWKPID